MRGLVDGVRDLIWNGVLPFLRWSWRQNLYLRIMGPLLVIGGILFPFVILYTFYLLLT